MSFDLDAYNFLTFSFIVCKKGDNNIYLVGIHKKSLKSSLYSAEAMINALLLSR